MTDPDPGRKIGGRVGFTAALGRVWYGSLVVGVYSVIPIVVQLPWEEDLDVGALVHAVIAFALGFLLVFRTNRAYERWWEARKLWGTLVNVSRNLAIKTIELADPDAMERSRVRTLVVGFGYGLKDHLRRGAELVRVPGFEKTGDQPQHVPSYIVGQLYALFSAWRTTHRISGDDLLMLDREARVLLEVAGGCERIKNTLTSQSFSVLVRQALALYLVFLPWSLAPELGWLTVPMAVMVSYFIIGAEGIAHHVERPFGDDEDHLDLDSICSGIDASVTEILER